MGRRDDDIFSDMLGGLFWTSLAIESHIGSMGCLFLFLLALPFICLFITLFALQEENIILFFVFLIITISVFALYIIAHQRDKAEEKKKEWIQLRYDELYHSYHNFVSGWGFPHIMDGELWRPGYIGVGIEGPLDKQKRQWIHWHAYQLAMFQATSESNSGGYKSDELPEYWLARNHDEWIVYRTISLIDPYALLTEYFVPSMDDLKESNLYTCFRRLTDSVIEEIQDIRTIKLAKQHARNELDIGQIIPVIEENS